MSPSISTVSVYRIEVYWLPASEWCKSPLPTVLFVCFQRHSAIFSHCSTNSVSLTMEVSQPTIAREYRSIIRATQTKPEYTGT